MKSILKYWKVLIALVLIGAALFLYFNKYRMELAEYQIKVQQMQQLEEALENVIQKNKRYEGIQDELEDAMLELDASRPSLYQHFPVELKEEDQIMYVLYLETIFGTEINFNFSQPQVVTGLYDGSRVWSCRSTTRPPTRASRIWSATWPGMIGLHPYMTLPFPMTPRRIRPPV